MKLKRPTDFLVLNCLLEGGRNVASNIALEIDKQRSYVNTRLPVLEDYGLIRKIGPSERSGLYEITQKGRAALKCEDQYGEEGVDFDQLIEQEVHEPDEDREKPPSA